MSAERKQISHQVWGMQIVAVKSQLFLNASKIRPAALPKNELYQCSTYASYIELHIVVVWLNYINYIIVIVMNIIVFTILQRQESCSSNWLFNFPSQDNIVLNTQGHNLLNTVTQAGWTIESFGMKIIVPSYTKSPIIMTVERERETVKEREASATTMSNQYVQQSPHQ